MKLIESFYRDVKLLVAMSVVIGLFGNLMGSASYYICVATCNVIVGVCGIVAVTERPNSMCRQFWDAYVAGKNQSWPQNIRKLSDAYFRWVKCHSQLLICSILSP